MSKIYLVVLLIGICFSLKAESNAVNNQRDLRVDSISEIINRNRSLLDSLVVENGKQEIKLRHLEGSRANSELRIENNQNTIKSINTEVVRNTLLSKIGAVILLLGLFMEVIGATLLAGKDLSGEIELIRSARLEYTLGDLAIADKMKDNVMTFYGMLGSLILVVGFCFSFTGTIIIIGLRWYIIIGLVLLAFISSFGVLYFLAGQNVNQSLAEKRKTFMRNLKRVLWYSVKRKLVGNKHVVCEVCQKKVLFAEAQVWYKQDYQSEEHPYLHPPYGFYLGHSTCLAEIYPENEKGKSLVMRPHPVYKFSASDFRNKKLNTLYDWNEERLKDLQRKRGTTKRIIDETEVSLRNLRLTLKNKK